ncbi:hypothetical protein Holit_00406 [Hollandina sp. SP2]
MIYNLLFSGCICPGIDIEDTVKVYCFSFMATLIGTASIQHPYGNWGNLLNEATGGLDNI